MTDQALLQVESVSKSYGQLAAVTDLSLVVGRGEIVGIVGPNGAGKSTLVGMICGDVGVDSGSIELNGINLTRAATEKRARRGIGRCFQVPRLFPTMTVNDNVSLVVKAAYRRAWRLWKPHDAAPGKDVVLHALEYVGIAGLGTRTVATISHGDRKMVELAMMVAQDPLLIVLDEPTAGVSLRDAERSIGVIATMAADRPDRGILVTSHDLDLIRALASRLVLMAGGRAIEEGTPAQVLAGEAAQEVFLGVDGSAASEVAL